MPKNGHAELIQSTPLPKFNSKHPGVLDSLAPQRAAFSLSPPRQPSFENSSGTSEPLIFVFFAIFSRSWPGAGFWTASCSCTQAELITNNNQPAAKFNIQAPTHR